MTDDNAQPSAAQQLADRLAQIIRSARESNLQRVEELTSLITGGSDRRSRRAAAEVAHKLAGSAGTFGFMAVSDQARVLEQDLVAMAATDQAAEASAGEEQRLVTQVAELRAGLLGEPDDVD